MARQWHEWQTHNGRMSVAGGINTAHVEEYIAEESGAAWGNNVRRIVHHNRGTLVVVGVIHHVCRHNVGKVITPVNL